MFDQLHDPNPPTATSHHLALAAERAAGMRRRRNTMVSGLGAVALLAAGTVAIAVTNDRGDGTNDVQFADTALSEVSGEVSEPVPAPTTTLLDPASLPPAVPVNPNPEDLPPAVPVNPDPDDTDDLSGTVGDDGDSDSTSGSDGGDTEQAAENEDSSGSQGDSTETTSSDEPVLDVATAAALRSNDPTTAITGSGTGVWFASTDAEPIVIDVGQGIERLDFFGDGTATVESRSGGSTLSTAHADGTSGPDVIVGTDHGVSPDGATVCGLDGSGTLIVCADIDGVEILSAPFDRSDVVGADLTWLDDDTVLVLGRWAPAWSLSTLEVSTGEVTTRPFASLSDFSDLRWAGRVNAEFAVHDAGTEVVLLGTLDRFGDAGDTDSSGTSLEVRRFDDPMRSVWYDGATEILVDGDGVLTVDGDELPGAYVSARR